MLDNINLVVYACQYLSRFNMVYSYTLAGYLIMNNACVSSQYLVHGTLVLFNLSEPAVGKDIACYPMGLGLVLHFQVWLLLLVPVLSFFFFSKRFCSDFCGWYISSISFQHQDFWDRFFVTNVSYDWSMVNWLIYLVPRKFSSGINVIYLYKWRGPWYHPCNYA